MNFKSEKYAGYISQNILNLFIMKLFNSKIKSVCNSWNVLKWQNYRNFWKTTMSQSQVITPKTLCFYYFVIFLAFLNNYETF